MAAGSGREAPAVVLETRLGPMLVLGAEAVGAMLVVHGRNLATGMPQSVSAKVPPRAE